MPALHVAFEVNRMSALADVVGHAFEQSSTSTLCGRELNVLEWLAYDTVGFDELGLDQRCRACQVLAEADVPEESTSASMS